MAQRAASPSTVLSRGWRRATEEPDHPLAALEGRDLAGARVAVALGPTSRFGARYFALYLSDDGSALSDEPVLRGLHRTGPLPTYNWIEVAETRDRVALPGGAEVDVDVAALFRLLYETLPPGGHLMVEYDSPQRAETARALALAVPAIATPLGAQLFRTGFGARFKDWQIAEGGTEGPRKLQAYKPASTEDAARWRREAAAQLDAFVAGAEEAPEVVRAARKRAKALLAELRS